METKFAQLFENVITGDQASVKMLVKQHLEQGDDPQDILNDGLIVAMAEVGNRFESGDFYVPEMLVSARAMQGGLEILKPLLVQQGVKSTGRTIIGTVKGDLHDIGKNLVAMMLEGAGFEIIDLGTDVSPEKFVEEVQKQQPNLIAMSALLTTTMPNMKVTIDALVQAGLRDNVKVIVGGAPVTQEYATKIGADGYGVDASRAVNLAKSLTNA
jgi:5-methyltetrahydrofolate--homocysteine methyltransferase